MDRDGDGQINVSEFCSAMSMIRQAKVQQQQTLNWPAGSTGGMVNRGGDVIIILIIVTGAKPYA